MRTFVGVVALLCVVGLVQAQKDGKKPPKDAKKATVDKVDLKDNILVVKWGDGKVSSLTGSNIQSLTGGNFALLSSHTYALAGTYTLTVQVNDVGGITILNTKSITVT